MGPRFRGDERVSLIQHQDWIASSLTLFAMTYPPRSPQ
jgi:hypothetical protein